jgi:hypothetical protein
VTPDEKFGGTRKRRRNRRNDLALPRTKTWLRIAQSWLDLVSRPGRF